MPSLHPHNATELESSLSHLLDLGKRYCYNKSIFEVPGKYDCCSVQRGCRAFGPVPQPYHPSKVPNWGLRLTIVHSLIIQPKRVPFLDRQMLLLPELPGLPQVECPQHELRKLRYCLETHSLRQLR